MICPCPVVVRRPHGGDGRERGEHGDARAPREKQHGVYLPREAQGHCGLLGSWVSAVAVAGWRDSCTLDIYLY